MSGKMDKDEWKSKKRGYEDLFCRFVLLCCDLSGFAVLDWMSVSGESGQGWCFKQHQRARANIPAMPDTQNDTETKVAEI